MSTGFVQRNKREDDRLGRRDPNVHPWTVEHIEACADALDEAWPIVVLANREPIRHDRAADAHYEPAEVYQFLRRPMCATSEAYTTSTTITSRPTAAGVIMRRPCT